MLWDLQTDELPAKQSETEENAGEKDKEPLPAIDQYLISADEQVTQRVKEQTDANVKIPPYSSYI